MSLENLRCEKCGRPATKAVVDRMEVNGGVVQGAEHLPPMIHKQHLAPKGTCEEHAREPMLIPNEDLRKTIAAHPANAGK